MATHYVCDRCKGQIPRLMYSLELISTGGSGKVTLDLCGACWQDARLFLDGHEVSR